MRIAVIGAGIMGTGIAQVCAEAGLDVWLCSRSRPGLDAAVERMRRNQAAMAAGGLLAPEAAEAARARVRTTQDMAEAVAAADFVSENVPEDLAVKQALFRDLERLVPPAAILSTDTSGLSITAIASAVAAPERVVGFHWLNPPHLMLPVEIIRGARTSEATVLATVGLAERLGRRPLRVERDVPGFLWNRLQLALVREAVHLVEQGIARVEEVDLAVQWGLGLRWAAAGPFRIMDLAGLETFRAVAASLYPVLSVADAPQAAFDAAIGAGHTGARGGRGFYAYPPGAHEALVQARDARLMALRAALAREPGGLPPGS